MDAMDAMDAMEVLNGYIRLKMRPDRSMSSSNGFFKSENQLAFNLSTNLEPQSYTRSNPTPMVRLI